MQKRIEKRTDEVVDKPIVKRGRVLPKHGPYFVHVMSRVVDRRFILGEREKEYFRKLMRAQAEFAGIKIVTYALMDNHFHILAEVPSAEDISDEELYRRVEVAQGREALLEFKQLVDRLVAQGAPRAAEEQKQRVKDRMYDLGTFMQQLKRLFTRWYNRHNERKGTLWEARFKSVVVQGAGNPLLTMASYIDLNAVRAGLVKDPKDYRFCGYGEAVSGNKEARKGLTRLQEVLGRSVDWRMVQRGYRKWIYSRHSSGLVGTSPEAQVDDQSTGTKSKQPFDRKQVIKVWENDGALTPYEIMRCKVRYFSDGVVLGSQEYVEELFESRRAYFGERRTTGARQLRCSPLNNLFALRDLRRDLVT